MPQVANLRQRILKNMLKEISAGAIVFRREAKNNSGKEKIKFLILKHYLGHWDFPRGIIEKGEKEKETAKREILEETGIQDIKFINGFRKTTNWQYKKTAEFLDNKNKNNQAFQSVFKTAILYLAETKTKKIKLSSEHQDYKWLEYNSAKEKLTFENSKILLGKANNFFGLK